MNAEEMVEVINAWKDGQPIEAREAYTTTWRPMCHPTFNFSMYDYRVAKYRRISGDYLEYDGDIYVAVWHGAHPEICDACSLKADCGELFNNRCPIHQHGARWYQLKDVNILKEHLCK